MAELNPRGVSFKFSFLTSYIFLLLLKAVTPLIPLWGLNICAQVLGTLAWKAGKKYRNRTLSNLGHAFPEKTEQERRDIGKKCFIHFILSFLETFHVPRLASKRNVKKTVEQENVHLLSEYLDQGKGVVVVVAHFGNWEMEGAATVGLGYPLNTLYFPQTNYLADHMINTMRERMGIKLIIKKNAIRRTKEALDRNEIVAFLSDQDAGSKGLFVDFFNRPASTVKGPVYFALKLNSPIALACLIRLKTGKYRFSIDKIPLKITGDFEKDLINGTQTWSNMLEKRIRMNPEQWLWVHRRWKTWEKKQRISS